MQIKVSTSKKVAQLAFLAIPGLLLLGALLGVGVYQKKGLSLDLAFVTAIPFLTAAYLVKYCAELSQNPGTWIIDINESSISQIAPDSSGDPSFTVLINDIKTIIRSQPNSNVPSRTHIIKKNGEKLWLGGNAPIPTFNIVREIAKVHPEIIIKGYEKRMKPA